MSMKMEDEIKRWTAKRKSALVLDNIQGKTTVSEASRSFDLTPSEVESWVEDGKRGMENTLGANPLDVREQYERQLKDLQEAYGEAMLELRARKNCSPSWARTRSDRDDPPGTSSRRHHRLDRQAVPMVRCAAPHCVLSIRESTRQSTTALCRTHQGIDRGVPVIWLSDGGLPARVQQEHGTAGLSIERLAGQEAPNRLAAPHTGAALGGDSAERTVVLAAFGPAEMAGRRWRW